jgi:hypothetical protein
VAGGATGGGRRAAGGGRRRQSTQHTAHSTQHTAHSTQHTAHSTQHTAHSTQHRGERRGEGRKGEGVCTSNGWATHPGCQRIVHLGFLCSAAQGAKAHVAFMANDAGVQLPAWLHSHASAGRRKKRAAAAIPHARTVTTSMSGSSAATYACSVPFSSTDRCAPHQRHRNAEGLHGPQCRQPRNPLTRLRNTLAIPPSPTYPFPTPRLPRCPVTQPR